MRELVRHEASAATPVEVLARARPFGRELVRHEPSAATPEEVLARARPFVWELVADSNYSI